MNYSIHNQEAHGLSNPADNREKTALACDEYCSRYHGAAAWLEETDKWYCDDCLVDYFCEELDKILEMDDWSDVVLVPHTDDSDEFTHFVIASGVPAWRIGEEITLEQLWNQR